MNNLVIVLIISSIVLAGFIGWLLNLRKIRGEERAINDFCNHSLKLLKESKKNKNQRSKYKVNSKKKVFKEDNL